MISRHDDLLPQERPRKPDDNWMVFVGHDTRRPKIFTVRRDKIPMPDPVMIAPLPGPDLM